MFGGDAWMEGPPVVRWRGSWGSWQGLWGKWTGDEDGVLIPTCARHGSSKLSKSCQVGDVEDRQVSEFSIPLSGIQWPVRLYYSAVNIRDSRSRPAPAVNNMSPVVQQPRKTKHWKHLDQPAHSKAVSKQDWAHSRPQHNSPRSQLQITHIPTCKHQISSPNPNRNPTALLEPTRKPLALSTPLQLPLHPFPPLQQLFSGISLVIVLPVSSPWAVSSIRDPVSFRGHDIVIGRGGNKAEWPKSSAPDETPKIPRRGHHILDVRRPVMPRC